MRVRLTLLFLLGLLAGAPAAAQADGGARRVAVLYFENTGNPELEMLKIGLAQMLIQDLAGAPGVDVVERTAINQLLGELDLQKSARVDPEKAVELGKLLGVERMVLGSYFELMGQFQMMARVVDVETGVIVGASEASGVVADFGKLEDKIAAELLPHLARTPAATEQGATLEKETVRKESGTAPLRGGKKRAKVEATGSSSQPPPAAEDFGEGGADSSNPLEAALAFSEGLDYLDRKDIPRAREALRRAVDLDPSLDAARDELSRLAL